MEIAVDCWNRDREKSHNQLENCRKEIARRKKQERETKKNIEKERMKQIEKNVLREREIGQRLRKKKRKKNYIQNKMQNIHWMTEGTSTFENKTITLLYNSSCYFIHL